MFVSIVQWIHLKPESTSHNSYRSVMTMAPTWFSAVCGTLKAVCKFMIINFGFFFIGQNDLTLTNNYHSAQRVSFFCTCLPADVGETQSIKIESNYIHWNILEMKVKTNKQEDKFDIVELNVSISHIVRKLWYITYYIQMYLGIPWKITNLRFKTPYSCSTHLLTVPIT